MYDRTSAKLYGICLRLLGNEAEAQDVLQEVYVTVWRKAARFDPAQGERDHLARRRSRATRRSTGCARASAAKRALDAAADVADDGPSAFDVVRAGRGCGAPRAIASKSSRRRARTMIRAAFLDGASYPELAEREGVPLRTMKSWIRRGLLRLRGCLEQ